MAKKAFDSISTGPVYSRIEEATTRGGKGVQIPASPEEQAERAADGRTQGRKGCKLARINMGFKTENYNYIRLVSRAMGCSITDFTNLIIENYRNEHPEIEEKAQTFLDGLEASGLPVQKIRND